MTPSQGVKINKKYTILVDSVKSVTVENKLLKKNIDTLNTNINSLNKKVFDLNSENSRLNNSLKLSNDSLNMKNKLIEEYEKKFKKFEYIDLSTRRRTTIGIGAAILTWITLAIISSKS